MKKLFFLFLLIPALLQAQYRTTNYGFRATTSGFNIINYSKLGINTLAPLHDVTVVTSRTLGMYGLNIVNSDLNKLRTTVAQATDTSSLQLYFTYTGSPLLTLRDKSGYVIFRADSIGFGLGTATPLTKLSVLTSTTVNNNAFNFVNSDINKRRDTYAQATDTSSFTLNYTATGSPTLKLMGKTGQNAFYVDSIGFGVGTMVPKTKLSVLANYATNINAFNFVESDINKRRDTFAQATDSSSISGTFSYTGSPQFKVTAKGGTVIAQIDSAGVTIVDNNALVLSGNATVWEDLIFPTHTLKTVGTTAKPDYDVVDQTLDFPEDTTEAVGFITQMPHSWKEGSTIYPHVHWLRASADSVDWTFRYKWFNIGAVLPTTWTEKKLSHNTQSYTSGTIHELSRVVNGAGLSGSGKTMSSILIVKFYRNSDPYSGDAKLLQIDIHYEIDALGSRTESAK